jgi:DUF4097 and DUF4098 domain-containing protein YvlB
MTTMAVKIHGVIFTLFLMLVETLGGYASENLSLVNTQTLSLEGIEVLSINYGGDEVILRESETSELIIREYMEKDRPRYYAVITHSAGTLSIKRGSRPWLPWFWKTARAEIYLPQNFRKNIKISNSSGVFRSEMDILDYKTIDVSVNSGSAFFKSLSAETLSIHLSSGDVYIGIAGGNSLISLSSGRLQIGELTGTEHRVRISSGRARIGVLQGTSSLEVSSGGIAVEYIMGNTAIEISSGNIQISELTGISHRIKASSGRTVIAKVRGRIDVNISSGFVNIGGFSGEGSFDVSSGNIVLDMREVTGDLRFKLSSGSIDMKIPRGIYFNLDAATKSGKVLVYEGGDEALRVSGNAAILHPLGSSPEFTVYARTNSGSLTINRE